MTGVTRLDHLLFMSADPPTAPSELEPSYRAQKMQYIHYIRSRYKISPYSESLQVVLTATRDKNSIAPPHPNLPNIRHNPTPTTYYYSLPTPGPVVVKVYVARLDTSSLEYPSRGVTGTD